METSHKETCDEEKEQQRRTTMIYGYNCPNPEDNGWVQEDSLPNFDDTKDFLKGIVESLYETGNVEQLEHCIEELCFQYDVKFKEKEPKLKNKEEDKLMNWYLGYQRNVIDKNQKSLSVEG